MYYFIKINLQITHLAGVFQHFITVVLLLVYKNNKSYYLIQTIFNFIASDLVHMYNTNVLLNIP